MILLRYTMIGLLISALLIFGAKVVLSYLLHRDEDYYDIRMKADNLEPETNSYVQPQGDLSKENGGGKSD